ncbi:DUF3085 domain-containing protein [Paracoccus sp. ME4]|uniref:DUF3085 domain-containing protein n=1 Tax=Paracoccus sp. ME4 TaxID=3138066 RepID=UPI00398AC56E
MAIISFYAEKIIALAKLSEENPGHRRLATEQAYSLEFLRADLDPARRAELEAKAEDGFCFDIEDGDRDASKAPSGVWLVGDQGVYIMMNVSMREPGLIPGPIEHAVQCFETDTRNLQPGEQFDAKTRIFGGDDGVLFLPSDFIMAVAAQQQAQLKLETPLLLLEIDEAGVSSPWREQAETYLAEMRAKDLAFFDPDSKAPPKLWTPPGPDETPAP